MSLFDDYHLALDDHHPIKLENIDIYIGIIEYNNSRTVVE